MKLLIKDSEVGLPNLIYQPVIAEGIPDYDEDSEEFELYWNLQNKRCIEGYKPDGQHPKITGEYYFHLNFWTINRPRMLFDNFEYGDDVDSFPLYRDIDHEIFEWLEKLRVKKINGIIGKRRRIGATVDFLSWQAHALMFQRSSNCALGAPADDNILKVMPLFYKGWYNMTSALKQDFREPSPSNQKTVGFKYADSSGERFSGSNSIFHINGFAKPGQFKGIKIKRGFIDEAGEFKGSKTGAGRTSLKDAYAETSECVSDGNYVTGTLVIAGTSDKVNNFSNDYEELIYDAAKYGLDYMFIPATKWYYPFFDVSTGKSIEEPAKEMELKKREELMQLPDKVPLFKRMQNYPLITEDMFVVRANSSMDMYRINDRIEQIMGDPEQRDKVLIGTLTETKDGRVEFAQHPQGKFRITEFPINHIYKGADIGGVDDYMKDIAPQSDSLGAIVIYRRFISANVPCKIPVAVYHYRPLSRQDFFKDCLLLAKFYDCELAAEFNDSGLYEYFKRHNALRYLKRYPIIMGKRTTPQASYGYSVKEQELDIIRTKLALFSESQELNNVYDVLFLRQMTEFDRKNTDVCFVEGTKIQTQDGFSNIENLRENDIVLTHTGEFHKVNRKFINKYDGNLYKIKVSGGSEIICTENHPVYSAKRQTPEGYTITGERWKFKNLLPVKRWTRAADLNKGEYLFLPKRKNLPKSSLSDFELYLMGWFITDGTISQIGQIRIVFALDQLHIAEHIKEQLIEYDFKDIVARTANTNKKNGQFARAIPRIKKEPDSNCYHLTFTSHKFVKILKENTVNKCKTLNQKMFCSSGLLPFIVGFFEGDGCLQSSKRSDGGFRSQLSANGVNYEMMRQLRQICLDEGLWCTMNYCVQNNEKHKTQLRIVIQDRDAVNRVAEKSLKFKKVISDVKQKFHHIEHPDGYWVPIKSIHTYRYEGNVFNLEVDVDNTYTADYIAVHNCSAMGICLLYDDDVSAVKVTKIQDPNALAQPIVVMRSITAKISDTGMIPQITGAPTKVSDWQQRLLNTYKGVPNTPKAPAYHGRELDPEESLYR